MSVRYHHVMEVRLLGEELECACLQGWRWGWVSVPVHPFTLFLWLYHVLSPHSDTRTHSLTQIRILLAPSHPATLSLSLCLCLYTLVNLTVPPQSLRICFPLSHARDDQSFPLIWGRMKTTHLRWSRGISDRSFRPCID